MSADRRSGRWETLGLGIYLLVVLGPLAVLAFQAAAAAWADPSRLSLGLPGGRRGILLLHSLLWSLGVAGAGLVIATPLAAALTMGASGWLRRARWGIVLLLPVPPYLQALAWIEGGRLAGLAPAGWLGAGWVEAMALLPLATVLALLALESVPPALVDAARMVHGSPRVLASVVLPAAAPALAAGGGLLFLLALGDSAVPTLFGKHVYALEVFAEMSAGATPGEAFLAALPLLAPAVAVLAVAWAPLRRLALRPPGPRPPEGSPLSFPLLLKLLALAALALGAAQVLVPLGVLSLEAGSPAAWARSLGQAREEIGWSVALAAGVALLALPPALALAERMRSGGGGWWWLAPLALPPSLAGVGVSATGLSGDLAPGLALLARYLPVAALVAAARSLTLDPALLDAARVHQASPWRGFSRVYLPLAAPGLLAAAFLTFSFALGDLGAVLPVAPPGKATLSMRIFNYLHYGATESVAGLCLGLLLVTLGAAGLAVGFLRGGRGGRHLGAWGLAAVVFLGGAGCARSPQAAAPEPGWTVVRPPHEVSALVLQEGRLWAGGLEGVYEVDLETAAARKAALQPPLEAVRALAAGPSGALFAGHSGGVTRLEGGEARTYTTAEGLPSNEVFSLLLDSRGRLWAGTREGAAFLEGDRFQAVPEAGGNRVEAMMEDSQGGLWFGSFGDPRGGVAVLRDGSWFRLGADQGLPHTHVNDLLEDRDGGVWVATGEHFRGGACRLERDGEGWRVAEVLTREQGLAGEKVRSLFLDREGGLWFGSEYDGMARLREGTWEVWGPERGLPHPEVKAFVQDPEGALWLATGDGLVRIPRR